MSPVLMLQTSSTYEYNFLLAVISFMTLKSIVLFHYKIPLQFVIKSARYNTGNYE
jgi:hypothetical protein